MHLRLDFCDHKAALYACEHWHYSKCVPKGKLVKIGVWEDGQFQGAIIFSPGASSHLGKPYGLGPFEITELTRVALRKHQTPVSKLISIAIKLLKKHCPGLRLIVSFADPHEGHNGGIYQAGNWIYAGKTGKGITYFDKSGKRWHSRNVGKEALVETSGWGMKKAPSKNLMRVIRPGKHRYLYPLDQEMKDRVMSLAQPYPKKEASVAQQVEYPASTREMVVQVQPGRSNSSTKD